MKVKELINWLKKQDQESFVGILDYGQDSGDWTNLKEIEMQLSINGDYTPSLIPNFQILTYEQATFKLKRDGNFQDLKHFKETYKND